MMIYQYGGFWRRLVAFSMDLFFVSFLMVCFMLIGGMVFVYGIFSGFHGQIIPEDIFLPEQFFSFFVLSWLLFVFVFIAYFTYFHGVVGWTPGKRLLRLKVIKENGSDMTPGTAFLRAAGYLISSIFYLGFFWVARDVRKQGWHDKIAGTLVIVDDHRPTPPDASPFHGVESPATRQPQDFEGHDIRSREDSQPV